MQRYYFVKTFIGFHVEVSQFEFGRMLAAARNFHHPSFYTLEYVYYGPVVIVTLTSRNIHS